MALKYSELAAFLVLLIIGFTDVFCVDPKQYDPLLFDRPSNQRNPSDPWNRKNYDPLALEGGINKQPIPSNPPSGKRNFVATPAKPPTSTDNKQTGQPQQNPNLNNQPGTQNNQGGKRDYVATPSTTTNNDNKQTGANQQNLNLNKQPGSQNNQGGKRDFVATPSTTTPWPELGKKKNAGPSQPAQPLPNPVWVRPTTPASKRDYVAPNLGNKNQQFPPLPNQQNPKNPINNPNDKKPSNTNTRDYVNPNSPNVKPQVPPVIGAPSTVVPSTPKSPVSFIGGTTPTTTTTKPAATTLNPKEKNKLSEDNELREFSEALLKKDVNSPLKYITINYQGMTRSSSFKDEAPQPLLTISQDAYKIPSVAKLILLHNNYILESTQNEVYTAQEKIEENNFLDTILPTSVMQHTRNFLIQKGKLEKDPKVFRDLLKTIWFNMYSRGGGKIGSSGFEHVFLAEIKNDTISGLHNYLYFKEEEQKNKANYLGYMKKLEFEKGAILKYHFNFHNIDKPVGSMFVGTSPELEIALYSTCFILRPNDVCPLRLAGKNFGIRTYSYRYRGKNMIGSAFPDI